MADVKQLNANNNSYNIKDETARNAIANLDTVNLASAGGDDGTIKFGIDGNGNYGYYKAGADTVTPFKSGVAVPIKRIECHHDASGFAFARVVIDVSNYSTIKYTVTSTTNSNYFTSSAGTRLAGTYTDNVSNMNEYFIAAYNYVALGDTYDATCNIRSIELS